MIIANIDEMLDHKFGEDYEHKGHKWVNQRMACGCISAVCIDVAPNKEDCDAVTRLFTKNNTLQTMISEAMKSDDEEIRKRIADFQKELEDTKFALKKFIDDKRPAYDFPTSTDFNSEYYFIKLKQNPGCRD